MEPSYEIRAVSALVETLKGSPLPTEKVVVADTEGKGDWIQHVTHKTEMSFPFGLYDKETGAHPYQTIPYSYLH